MNGYAQGRLNDYSGKLLNMKTSNELIFVCSQQLRLVINYNIDDFLMKNTFL